MSNGNLGAEGEARPKKPIIPDVRLWASGSQNQDGAPQLGEVMREIMGHLERLTGAVRDTQTR